MGANPFAAVAELWSPLAMKAYLALMVAAVVIGTLFDVSHRGSGIYFAQRREKAKASARRQLGGGQTLPLALATVAEPAVSGEFDKTPRRISHLLTMYGYIGHGTRKSCRRSHWSLTSEEPGKGKIPC